MCVTNKFSKINKDNNPFECIAIELFTAIGYKLCKPYASKKMFGLQCKPFKISKNVYCLLNFFFSVRTYMPERVCVPATLLYIVLRKLLPLGQDWGPGPSVRLMPFNSGLICISIPNQIFQLPAGRTHTLTQFPQCCSKWLHKKQLLHTRTHTHAHPDPVRFNSIFAGD